KARCLRSKSKQRGEGSRWSALLFRLGGEQQRIALGLAGVGCPRRLGLGDVAREDGDHTDATCVCRDHYTMRLILAELEFTLEHGHHELARREIVIDQDDLVELWPLGLRLRLGTGFEHGFGHRNSPVGNWVLASTRSCKEAGVHLPAVAAGAGSRPY